MELQIISLIISALSLPTLFGIIWKDIIEHRKSRSAAAVEARKQERVEEIRAVVREETAAIKKDLEKANKKLDEVGEGTQSSLRNEILMCYDACVAKGYRSYFDTENVKHLHDSYDALNGNSFIDDIMVLFDELPTEEEYVKTHGGTKDGKQQ